MKKQQFHNRHVLELFENNQFLFLVYDDTRFVWSLRVLLHDRLYKLRMFVHLLTISINIIGIVQKYAMMLQFYSGVPEDSQ